MPASFGYVPYSVVPVELLAGGQSFGEIAPASQQVGTLLLTGRLTLLAMPEQDHCPGLHQSMMPEFA
jgi:hypothetical protein